jgi:hypothetical protein
MTPEEFRRTVLPRILDAWDSRCFCRSEAFIRLVSLDLGSSALADAQILIHEIIEKRFVEKASVDKPAGRDGRSFTCPQCGTTCVVVWEQLSSAMDALHVEWPSAVVASGAVPYLVGFYGHEPPDEVDGLIRTRDPEVLLNARKSQ